jgi:hypothetical protein
MPYSYQESNGLLCLEKLYAAIIFMWKMYKYDSVNWLCALVDMENGARIYNYKLFPF